MNDVTFAWSYTDNLATVFYKPAWVFKSFSFTDLLDEKKSCVCSSAVRLKRFIDPLTLNESSSFSKPGLHVRSMDMNIIQHPGLRCALAQGLNHIPLRPSKIAEAMAVIMDAFTQLCEILGLTKQSFPMTEARLYLHSTCLDILKVASKTNKFGFRCTGEFILDNPVVQNEINWLLSHLFCAGLDKAANNACFLCIRHIRLQALERLMGNDFLPCKGKITWLLPTKILDQVTLDLKLILPECPPCFTALPYLMATFKFHKSKYRWLTNAHNTVFSGIATLLTITSNLILDTFKSWAKVTEQGYRNFLKTDTSLCWIVDSIIDATLNFPSHMTDIFVADITRCYESIPLQGEDNLLDATNFITNIAFRHASLLHPRCSIQLYVRIASDGTPVVAKWATSAQQSGTWFDLSAERLLSLHSWLIKNCYVVLGDRVWLQKTGIPMGFSCSPIWCNLYLLSYEVKFIQRLAHLGRSDLLTRFKNANRYIDDLCLINVTNPWDFLSHDQPRVLDNPFWIYPLQFLEIKEETSSFSPLVPGRGIAAHFMNVEIMINETLPTQFQFCKFDKRHSLPFKYTQYIKFKSNRCVKQAYNIAIS